MAPHGRDHTSCCNEMQSHLGDRQIPVVYNGRFREYGIRVLDGGTAIQRITVCPWCGEPVPSSLRLQWFQRLTDRGLEPESPDLPDVMKTDAWWRAEGL